MKSIYKLNKDGFELDLSFFDYYLFDKQKSFYNQKLIKLFGLPRKKNSVLKTEHYQNSGALQRSFTEIVFHLLNLAKKVADLVKTVIAEELQ